MTLEIWGNPDYPDYDTSFSAGVLEGYVTAQYICNHWKNTREYNLKGQFKTEERTADTFFKNNYDYIMAQLKMYIRSYWYQVNK